jgi:TPR repeat protein
MLAMCNVGYMLQHGIGTGKKESEAVKWYSRGSDAGSELCTFNLAAMYEGGIGVDKDIPRAKELYLKAAEMGMKDAKERAERL